MISYYISDDQRAMNIAAAKRENARYDAEERRVTNMDSMLADGINVHEHWRYNHDTDKWEERGSMPPSFEQEQYAAFRSIKDHFTQEAYTDEDDFDTVWVYDGEKNRTIYSCLDVNFWETKAAVKALRGTPYEEEAEAILKAVEDRRSDFIKLVRAGKLRQRCWAGSGWKFYWRVLEERHCKTRDSIELEKLEAEIRENTRRYKERKRAGGNFQQEGGGKWQSAY